MKSFKRVHFIGIGGIHVSAVARLLHARGVQVSGSDGVESDEVKKLRAEGIKVTVGHHTANLPPSTEAVVYSDAVPVNNPERLLALEHDMPSFNSHAFLAMLFSSATQIVVTGTHGKSTTTAMVGKILEAAGADPTVVVGTRVPGWEYGNLRIGRSDLLVVEGDEYKSHVLSYRPTVLAITNIEWDHPDIFRTDEAYRALFRQAEAHVVPGGTVVKGGEELPITLNIPGAHNRKNAALARATARAYKSDIPEETITAALQAFPGVWRRFERVGEWNGAPVISDYGHHPTEVRETLNAAKEAFPDRRILLCYQPHQRARTKQLFNAFLPVLHGVDALILAEIYDVPGREEPEYADVSSKKLLDALPPSDQPRSYAATIQDAEQQVRALAQPNDVILIMGAGPIDQIARNLVSEKAPRLTPTHTATVPTASALTPAQIAAITSAVPGVAQNEPMSKHTNMRIGGPARLYVALGSADAIVQAIHAADAAKVPWYVFGGGSNLLVADEGFEGLVIQSAIRDLTIHDDRITAGSGVITALVARKAADAGLTGFEWAIGVPGTIGGAVYGNAGCYGGEMKDVVESIDAYDIARKRRVIYTNAECGFAYRESRFKKERHVLFGCTIALAPGNATAAKARMQEIVETRKEKQPLDAASAGCAFKNYEFADLSDIAKLQSVLSVPQRMKDAKRIPAGWLVEQAGLLGASIGNMSVSQKHGNFLIQKSGATAKDAVALMQHIKQVVHEKFGVELQEEVQLLGL